MSKHQEGESFEMNGLRVERFGRFMRLRNVRGPGEHREAMRRAARLREDLPQVIAQQVSELEVILDRYDPLDIIAHISFLNMSADPETYKEWAHEGQQANVEYVTLLCLKKPHHTPADAHDRLIDGSVVEDVQKRLSQIHSDTMRLIGTKHLDPDRAGPPPALEELQFLSAIHGLFVRNPGYTQHLEELLRGLLDPLAEWMESTLGFSVDDAIAFEYAIHTLVNGRMIARREAVKAGEKNLRRDVAAFRKDGSLHGNYIRETMTKLIGLKGDEMKGAIRQLFIGWMFFALGETYAFTAEELAAEASLPVDRATAFLNYMSISFGEVEKDFFMPVAEHQLRTRPIVRHNDRYLCPVTGMITWGLRYALERTLKGHQKMWNRYEKHRSRYLETQTLNLLSKLLGGVPYHTRLRFKREEGEAQDELDGLLTWDKALFLVECKAGRFSASARRGADKSMI